MGVLRWLGCLVAAMGVGCAHGNGTERPSPERVGAALEKVLAAEAESMRADGDGHRVRRRARNEFQQATDALKHARNAEAARLFDRAEADAELAVALAREQKWTAELREAEAALRDDHD